VAFGDAFEEVLESVPGEVFEPKVVLMTELVSSEVSIARVFAVVEEELVDFSVISRASNLSSNNCQDIDSAFLGEVDTHEVLITEIDGAYERNILGRHI
jgi:DNA-binding transcriptional regulator YdaS (Cro superfamily)